MYGKYELIWSCVVGEPGNNDQIYDKIVSILKKKVCYLLQRRKIIRYAEYDTVYLNLI